MALSELTLQLIAFRVLALLLISGVHGGIIAAAGVWLGDSGPKYDGRMTVSPVAHVDLLGGVSFVLFGLGWARPVDIDPKDLRTGPAGVLLVILAGFAGLLALAALLDALILPALTTLSHSAALTVAAFLRSCGELSIWVALLSLVPVPPLAGGLLLRAVGIPLPPQARWALAAVVIAAVATGVARDLLAPVYTGLAPYLLGE